MDKEMDPEDDDNDDDDYEDMMQQQEDLDHHANQCNPNNDSY